MPDIPEQSINAIDQWFKEKPETFEHFMQAPDLRELKNRIDEVAEQPDNGLVNKGILVWKRALIDRTVQRWNEKRRAEKSE